MKRKERKRINKVLIPIAILVWSIVIFKGCDSCSGSKEYKAEYWQSIAREKQLRDAGFINMANEEEEERQRKLQEGLYDKTEFDYEFEENHTPIQEYKGSQEQKNDLEMIDKMMKENPNF
jgi:hypothetical protein